MTGKTSPEMPVFQQELILTLVAVLLLILLYNTGIYKAWFQHRVKDNFDMMLEQSIAPASAEEREQQIWGKGYAASKYIAAYFERQHIQDPVVLLEPNEYLQQTMGFKLPEPIIFYYFTGGKVRSLWMNSKQVEDAQYVVFLKPGSVVIQKINGKRQLALVLDKYKSYKQEL